MSDTFYKISKKKVVFKKKKFLKIFLRMIAIYFSQEILKFYDKSELLFLCSESNQIFSLFKV